MKWVCLIVSLAVACSALAQSSDDVMTVMTVHYVQATGGEPTLDDVWQSSIDGHSWGWSLTNAVPTAAQIITEAPTARTWLANYRKDTKANFDNWTNAELKAVVKVLLDEINILRAKASLPARTPAQLKQAIKDKLP